MDTSRLWSSHLLADQREHDEPGQEEFSLVDFEKKIVGLPLEAADGEDAVPEALAEARVW